MQICGQTRCRRYSNAKIANAADSPVRLNFRRSLCSYFYSTKRRANKIPMPLALSTERSRVWGAAAFTIRLVAALHATASMKNGLCRISKKCSITSRSLGLFICRRIALRISPFSCVCSPKPSTMFCATCSTQAAVSIRLPTPTARVKKAFSSRGRSQNYATRLMWRNSSLCAVFTAQTNWATLKALTYSSYRAR